MSGIENLLSIVMVYRIRSDEFRDLWKITLNAIDGILKTADRDFELIVVDNGSITMEYASELAQRAMVFDKLCPYVKGFKHFRIEEPAALSKAWNLGVYQADGDYVVMSNNDIVFHEIGWMSRLIEPFSFPNRKIGIVGIQHMSWYMAGGFVEGSLFAFPASFKEEFDLRETPEVEDYPIIFDEQFQLSCEDVDLNLRVQKAGYETIQVDNPPLQPRFLQHLGHRTQQTMAGFEDVIEISHESRVKLCRKYGWPEEIKD